MFVESSFCITRRVQAISFSLLCFSVEMLVLKVFSEHSFETSRSLSPPRQMKKNQKFHKDLATGRNEKKEWCVCLPVQDFSARWHSCLLCQGETSAVMAVDPLVLQGGPGSGCFSLFVLWVRDFYLNLKSGNERTANNIYNPST